MNKYLVSYNVVYRVPTVDDVLELDEPAFEMDLIFPPLEKEEADVGGDDDGGAKA